MPWHGIGWLAAPVAARRPEARPSPRLLGPRLLAQAACPKAAPFWAREARPRRVDAVEEEAAEEKEEEEEEEEEEAAEEGEEEEEAAGEEAAAAAALLAPYSGALLTDARCPMPAALDIPWCGSAPDDGGAEGSPRAGAPGPGKTGRSPPAAYLQPAAAHLPPTCSRMHPGCYLAHPILLCPQASEPVEDVQQLSSAVMREVQPR